MRVLSGYTLLLLVVQPVVFSGIGFMLAKSAGRDVPDLIYTIMGGGFMGLWSGVLSVSHLVEMMREVDQINSRFVRNELDDYLKAIVSGVTFARKKASVCAMRD